MILRVTRLTRIIVFLLGSVSASFAQSSKPLIVREQIDPQFNNLVSKNVKAEIIATGFEWCEGPLWIESNKMLLFSDVKKNVIYKWTKEKGKQVYLKPSGYTGAVPRGGELGSNGLGLNIKGQLVICQDGDRVVSVMDAPLTKPQAKFIKIASGYKGKKFDSPNDLAFLSNGDIYFTDPPYGLEKNVDDPLKEAKYQGVYKISKNGKVTLLTDTLTRPNGIAFFPGGKTVLIANSDPAKPYWYAYDLDKNGLFTNGRIFYSAKAASKTAEGMPDGLKIDKAGNVFTSGPGGLWFFNRNGKLLGKIKVNDVASNCSLSADEKTMYVTSNHRVLKIQLR
ncbi:SMP-30/gluconolactonase/LRE family protein [Mucilaginibacter sabulilitoris]|uniref:SMP-30/gluconolactonase/LRE family protein n=1 Tax=Mucilaginibacter sabulilitoris TaxID=1173583 RepID=A0ABZ0TTE7_9SPHI|nr:SMP-30/gluconolactonase/LRE family protein [Mucilaginibacter sabulilitoris]WPU96374.1 SMP-30/gluconolactonase/LRE family protein [Mucilaginibacter sabulilitoris]